MLVQKLKEAEDRINILQIEKQELIHKWEEFYASETFKFVVRPLWKSFDFLKEIAGFGKPRFAVIKPYVVSYDELNQFISFLRQREKNCKLYGFISCNSGESHIYKNIWAEKKLMFLRDKKIDMFLKILLFLFISLLIRFRRVYILESYPIPQGYRKSRLLGALLSTPETYIYYLYHNKEEKQSSLFNLILKFIFSRISLYIIVFFFTFVVTPWIELKKLFKRK